MHRKAAIALCALSAMLLSAMLLVALGAGFATRAPAEPARDFDVLAADSSDRRAIRSLLSEPKVQRDLRRNGRSVVFYFRDCYSGEVRSSIRTGPDADAGGEALSALFALPREEVDALMESEWTSTATDLRVFVDWDSGRAIVMEFLVVPGIGQSPGWTDLHDELAKAALSVEVPGWNRPAPRTRIKVPVFGTLALPW